MAFGLRRSKGPRRESQEVATVMTENIHSKNEWLFKSKFNYNIVTSTFTATAAGNIEQKQIMAWHDTREMDARLCLQC